MPHETEVHFYRSSAGLKIDLVLTLQGAAIWAIEIKRTTSLKASGGFDVGSVIREAVSGFWWLQASAKCLDRGAMAMPLNTAMVRGAPD